MPDDLNQPSTESAQDHLARAKDILKSGDNDAALTEFRRAALADPNLFEAQFEIGLLCRRKAEHDPIFRRYSFEALQKAIQLRKDHEEAHNQYIMISQKMGRMEELLQEYDGWLKEDPKNELLKKCRHNILTISMAMMPDKVNISDGGAGKTLRKAVLFVSLGAILFGFAMLTGPMIIKNVMKKTLTKEQAKNMANVGFFLGAAGLAGLFVRSRL